MVWSSAVPRGVGGLDLPRGELVDQVDAVGAAHVMTKITRVSNCLTQKETGVSRHGLGVQPLFAPGSNMSQDSRNIQWGRKLLSNDTHAEKALRSCHGSYSRAVNRPPGQHMPVSPTEISNLSFYLGLRLWSHGVEENEGEDNTNRPTSRTRHYRLQSFPHPSRVYTRCLRLVG